MFWLYTKVKRIWTWLHFQFRSKTFEELRALPSSQLTISEMIMVDAEEARREREKIVLNDMRRWVVH